MEKIDLEFAGGEDYFVHRIPGMVCTRKGTLLAYCESRVDEAGGDWAKIDITLRRSVDDGKTWTDRQILVPNEGDTKNNPVMITTPDSDVIHFLWHRNYAQCFYQRSEDEGVTWSEPVDITYAFEQFRPEYNWEVNASGPGHATALTNGRLVVPIWLSERHEHVPSVCGCILSDDGGKTWRRGGLIHSDDTLKNPNESTLAELSDGRLLINMRSLSEPLLRAVAISEDGGESFGPVSFDETLCDPICAAGMTRLPDEPRRIVFSNCARRKGGDRSNLTIRLSDDDCKTWSRSIVVENLSGYSDVCVSPVSGHLFCYYEHNWFKGNCIPERLTVARLSLDELQ